MLLDVGSIPTVSTMSLTYSMIMELENLNIHCRNCQNYEKRPKGYYHAYLASTPVEEFFPSISKFLPNVRAAKAMLGVCRPLFFYYENLIDIGPDSFVFVDGIEDPEYVVKMYLNTSLGRINEYSEEIQSYNKLLEGRKFILNGKEFTVEVNPIFEIMELGNPTCIATLSKYISGENEYIRYMRERHELYPDTSGVRSYEKELRNALGRYLDPRNFKVDEEKEIIIITDLASTLGE